MSTNHNRIRVADLETNEPNKILKTNQNGELEFSDVNGLQVDSYNALDCTTKGKTLDARQGKILKEMIENVSTSPVSLVNDLTTGGTNTALTAEMGKQLDETKHPLEDQRLSQDQTVKFERVIVKDGKYVSYIEPFQLLAQNAETYFSTRLTPDAIIAQSNVARKLEIKYNSINFIEDPYTDKKGSLQTQFLTGARSWQLQDKDGIVALTNDNVVTAPGNTIRPSLIIPNGTLTSTPQNGAIERDENGELWETHNGVRSKLVRTAGIEIKGEFSNNGTAVEGGLKLGDFYTLPVTVPGNIGFVAVVKAMPSVLKLYFSNINSTSVALNIADKNNINDWNNYFTTKGSANFSSVIIEGNEAKFTADDPSLIKVIKLDNSQITNVDFFNLNEITDIDLSNNEITNFDTSTISAKLINLILSNNKLTNFDNSASLPETTKKLILRGNNISYFEQYYKLPDSIEELNLADNLLQYAENLIWPANLKVLNLKNNRFWSFMTTVPNSLETLLLSGNQLNSWKANSIRQTNLLLLDLADNQISDFDSDNLNDSLYELRLGNNLLTKFNPVWIPSKLMIINLENNPITTDSWNQNFQWARNLSQGGTIYTGGTTGSIHGTDTESFLVGFNWTIQKTPYPSL